MKFNYLLHVLLADGEINILLLLPHQPDVPRYQRLTLGRRAFSVAGPTVWNSLPDELRDEPDDMFRKSLKTLYLDNISVLSALEVFLRQCAL